MRIHLTSVFVDDQEHALRFYTETLGFVRKHDVPVGTDRWLTVVSPEAPDGTELLLEPSGHPAVRPYRTALAEDGMRAAGFDEARLETDTFNTQSRAFYAKHGYAEVDTYPDEEWDSGFTTVLLVKALG